MIFFVMHGHSTHFSNPFLTWTQGCQSDLTEKHKRMHNIDIWHPWLGPRLSWDVASGNLKTWTEYIVEALHSSTDITLKSCIPSLSYLYFKVVYYALVPS